MPPLRKNRVVKVAAESAEVETKATVADDVADEDVEYWFKIMQEKMTTRFWELRRGFRRWW